MGPVGWTALLAAVLLPVAVALLWLGWMDAGHRSREAARAAALETRVVAQEEEIASLRREVRMLEADLDSVIDLD